MLGPGGSAFSQDVYWLGTSHEFHLDPHWDTGLQPIDGEHVHINIVDGNPAAAPFSPRISTPVTLPNSDFYLGENGGNDATLTVENGGSLQNRRTFIALNPDAAGVEQRSVRFFFDSYRIDLENLGTSGNIEIDEIELNRTVGATDSLVQTELVGLDLAPGSTGSATMVVPAPRVNAIDQTLQWFFKTPPADSSGSRVVYEKVVAKPAALDATSAVVLQPLDVPLAGGLNDFDLRIFNPGSIRGRETRRSLSSLTLARRALAMKLSRQAPKLSPRGPPASTTGLAAALTTSTRRESCLTFLRKLRGRR